MMRLVHLNPIESSTISARATAGYDCVIDIVYRNAADQKYTSDLAATLVLTARSSDSSLSYIVPATDLANGKARVTIPGGDLSDPNGYVMTLVGTVEGVRKVIANGTLMLSEEGIPNIDIADAIDTVDLTFGYGQPQSFDVTLWEDASASVPYDLTAEGTSVTAAVYASQHGAQLVPFSLTVLAANKVRMSLTIPQVDALPASCWWDLTAATAQGVTTLCEGTVTITGP